MAAGALRLHATLRRTSCIDLLLSACLESTRDHVYEQCLNPALWWWNPSHPSHAANLAEFWRSYTAVAVKYAGLSQQWGVEMFSLGTETETLFRTRPSGDWTNSFLSQLQQMVSAVRGVYSGFVTYDMHYSAIQHPEYFNGGNGSAFMFQDVGLDVIGVSAYFELAPSPVDV